MLFCIFSKVVLVECKILKVDWYNLFRWYVFIWLVNCLVIVFLMIFEISVRLEIGWKFENCLKLVLGFFRDGDKVVIFNVLGILLVERDKLINLVIVGSNIEK